MSNFSSPKKKPLPKLNLGSGPTTLNLQKYPYISGPYNYENISLFFLKYEKKFMMSSEK
jgi:hypothetical protein